MGSLKMVPKKDFGNVRKIIFQGILRILFGPFLKQPLKTYGENGADSWVAKKIEDQESLNVFIQSLFSDADRLNMKPSKLSYPIPTLTDTTTLVSKYDKFTKIINQADDEMII